MSDWFLRGIAVVGDTEFEATFGKADEERRYRFTTEDVSIDGTTLLTVSGPEFDADSLLDRDQAGLVIKAVTALHKATARPVALTDRSGV